MTGGRGRVRTGGGVSPGEGAGARGGGGSLSTAKPSIRRARGRAMHDAHGHATGAFMVMAMREERMGEDERDGLRAALGRSQDAERLPVYLCGRDALTVMRRAPAVYLALIDAVSRRARDEVGITLTFAAGGAGERVPGAGSEVEGGGKVREFEGPGSQIGRAHV